MDSNAIQSLFLTLLKCPHHETDLLQAVIQRPSFSHLEVPPFPKACHCLGGRGSRVAFLQSLGPGVPLWCNRLGIQHCQCDGSGRCCGEGLTPAPGTSAYHRHGQTKKSFENPHCGSAGFRIPCGLCKDVGSIPGLTQLLTIQCCLKLKCRLQMQFESIVAVAVV